ncbi:hypothetical protein K469DRAFT_10555 [Zopfia rhizophila CBS 207.26]|uniref:Uncharacterized protein n=1 Tax=Zopfia rhizophila CBS 207.26 TaxID=1314779 RepID=A0A6A6EX70_9PEZI|nr:hypothetical protein K469DRAFT_10555 [Zopfia rhizophila CBS 207.26]
MDSSERLLVKVTIRVTILLPSFGLVTGAFAQEFKLSCMDLWAAIALSAPPPPTCLEWIDTLGCSCSSSTTSADLPSFQN